MSVLIDYIINPIVEGVTSPRSDQAWFYVVPAVIVVAVFTRARGQTINSGLLFTSRTLRSRSTVVDLLLFALGAVVAEATGLLSLARRCATATSNVVPDPQWLSEWSNDHRNIAMMATTIFVLVATDFAQFITHWSLHRFELLWRVHQVHHETRLLTPLSAARVHPIEMIFGVVVATIVTVVANVAWLSLVTGPMPIYRVLGANAFGFAFRAALSSVRHSPVPISFGPLENLVVSPRMHQLHHSIDRADYDTNFGVIFSFWDRFIGTYRIPAKGQRFTFGVEGRSGSSIRAALMAPFVRADSRQPHHDIQPTPRTVDMQSSH
jgi:sterol desaturase/sphingolipid hydroxylase (fatty acid hydroxylase superfamily)